MFATRNGEGVLPRTLAAYEVVAGADRHWRLVIVDNGSSDATPDILRSFMNRLPLTIIVHPVPGKNRALNAGLSALNGDFAIVTDDDAMPQDGFIDAWRDVMTEQGEYDIFGGAIRPTFDQKPPEWFVASAPHFDALYSQNLRTDGPVDHSCIFGPNMAVRAKVFQSGLRFPENIGPNGSDINYPMGSETAFCKLAAEAGHKLYFTEKPAVQHIVRPSQMTSTFFRSRAYRLGRGQAQLQWESGTLKPRVRRSALVFTAGLAKRRMMQALLQAQTLRANPLTRFNARWQYDYFRGFHDEYEARRISFRADEATRRGTSQHGHGLASRADP